MPFNHDQLRDSKGKFAKQKKINKSLNCVAAMNLAKSEKSEQTYRPNLCIGRRIVELNELGKNLKCDQCKNVLSLEKITKEKRLGLNSILDIVCNECAVITQVATGKMHVTKNKYKHSDVNTKAVLGAVHAGIGCTALNKLLSSMNMPAISSNLYKRYEREIGPAIEEAAKESCKRAATLERQLIIDKIKELKDKLPEEIFNEIHPQYSTLQECVGLEKEGDTPANRTAKFDAAVGEICSIIVSYDMGWSERGNGKSYNSLNGYGSIIGFLSGKILDYAVRNRKCKLCDNGNSKNDHDCRKNHDGSAKAMEASVGVELVNRSKILNEAGLKVRVLVGDDDSSTISAVRRGTTDKIFKLSDTNHLNKHFVSALMNLKQSFAEMRKPETIPHIKKCFTYAVQQNKGKISQLASTLRHLPDHIFGSHENCGSWCHRGPNGNSKPQTVTIENDNLQNKLREIFNRYADNAAKFSVAASSQANESFNNIVAHKAPKNHCYSLSESCSYRVASAVITKNDGDSHLLNVQKTLCVSPGRHTESYALKNDKTREKRAIKAKLPANKKRRRLLTLNKAASTRRIENREGIQYQPNCGIEINDEGVHIAIDSKTLSDNLPHISLSTDTCNIVYFDLETSGFASTADILQIAAKYNKKTFNVYIKPTQPVNYQAFKITGLENINGNLFVHGKPVQSMPLRDALNAFQQFLSVSSKPCVLVAHNARFDSSHLLDAIIKNSMIENFANVAGFSDTVSLLRKCLPNRKGKDMFTLAKLAEDLLHSDLNGNFHEAAYDVEILEQLSTAFIDCEDSLKNCTTYRESVMMKIILPSLTPLKGVVSDMMIRRIAAEGITYEELTTLQVKSDPKSMVQLFSSKKVNGKARVTKDTRVLNKIIDFFYKN